MQNGNENKNAFESAIFDDDSADLLEFVLPPECQITQDGNSILLDGCIPSSQSGKRVSFDTSKNEYFTLERRPGANEDLFEADDDFQTSEFEISLGMADINSGVYSLKIEHQEPGPLEDTGMTTEMVGVVEEKLGEKENVIEMIEKEDLNIKKNKKQESGKNNELKPPSNDKEVEASRMPDYIKEEITKPQEIMDRPSEYSNKEKEIKVDNKEKDTIADSEKDLHKIKQEKSDFEEKAADTPKKANDNIVKSDQIEKQREDVERMIIIESIPRLKNNPFIMRDRGDI